MPERNLAVAIDTASDLAGVALTAEGALLGAVTWRTRQNQSRELLPALDWLLGRQGRGKEEIGAVFVCLGPGSYAGLRVGVSTAKALAFALDASLAGVGRLEADAEPLVAAAQGRVVAVHAAGRAELAWAAYGRGDDRPQELVAPRLSTAEALVDALQPGDRVCADPKALPASLGDAIAARDAVFVEAAPDRVLAVARLGRARLARGAVDNPDTLVPLYLRAPAIGPQR